MQSVILNRFLTCVCTVIIIIYLDIQQSTTCVLCSTSVGQFASHIGHCNEKSAARSNKLQQQITCLGLLSSLSYSQSCPKVAIIPQLIVTTPCMLTSHTYPQYIYSLYCWHWQCRVGALNFAIWCSHTILVYFWFND